MYQQPINPLCSCYIHSKICQPFQLFSLIISCHTTVRKCKLYYKILADGNILPKRWKNPELLKFLALSSAHYFNICFICEEKNKLFNYPYAFKQKKIVLISWLVWQILSNWCLTYQYWQFLFYITIYIIFWIFFPSNLVTHRLWFTYNEN